ncbi:MAG: RloB domain-containing protein [Chitinophagia bacterium]|nr:RloB domain-containing protein [Chitinophagia bacterium]
MRPTHPLREQKVVAFVCDGQCESWYLQMLKRNEHNLAVNVLPKIPKAKSLQEQFEVTVQLAAVSDSVFWIVDLDKINEESRQAAKGKKTALQQFHEFKAKLDSGRKKDFQRIKVIVNNPCFEFWLLLHFQATSRQFGSCTDVHKVLTHPKNLPDYQKSRDFYTRQGNDIYLQLKNKRQDAINNARKLGLYDTTDHSKAVAELFLLFEEDLFNQ